MIALSVHSCFEGLAAGLQMNFQQELYIILAIVIHKGAAASALGIALVKSFPNDFKLCRILVSVFACATPLGVGIGMALVGTDEIYEIIFNSLAAGTFVYIAASEIIVEEFSIPGYRWLKLFSFLFGALIITLLWFLE